jgi:magnesium-transporting ATPase (P-type)
MPACDFGPAGCAVVLAGDRGGDLPAAAHAAVAAKVCADLGLEPGQVATGADIDRAGDQLGELLARTTVFARVSPEHKAQIVREQRRTGDDVAFLGDGVNDAFALHTADVGVSVDSATDVAKDAADVLLLEKDLDVLADGVIGGRRIFANTMKYVLMGTSSNFGNMFSAAGASLFLTFLPIFLQRLQRRRGRRPGRFSAGERGGQVGDCEGEGKQRGRHLLG